MAIFKLSDEARITPLENIFRAPKDIAKVLIFKLASSIKNRHPCSRHMSFREEFSYSAEGPRRIDLLALDKQANLVVIELNRDETGSPASRNCKSPR